MRTNNGQMLCRKTIVDRKILPNLNTACEHNAIAGVDGGVRKRNL
jgi:hypothetical protein